VINAGDGAHEHPTGAARSLYDPRAQRKNAAGLHVAIIGDILFSRVARSNFGLPGWCIRDAGRLPTLVPREFENWALRCRIKIDDVPVESRCREPCGFSTNVSAEYFLGLGEYIRLFGLTKERAVLKPDCSSCIPPDQSRGRDRQRRADGLQSVIRSSHQRSSCRMAVLYLCGGISTQ
jgi:aspartate carbamoyltransferase catalytic subunit